MIPGSARRAPRLPRLRRFLSVVRWSVGSAVRYPLRSDRKAAVFLAGGTYWFLSDFVFFTLHATVFSPAQQQSTILYELVFNGFSIPIFGYLILVVQHGVHQRVTLPGVGSWPGLLWRGTKVWLITGVLTIVGPPVLASWVFGPMTAVVLRLVDAGVGSLASGLLEGPMFPVLVQLLTLVVAWYTFPAAIVIFSRRERMLDMISISRYQQVLLDTDYDQFIVVPVFIFVIVSRVFFVIELVAFSVVFEGGLVVSSRTVLALVVGYGVSMIGFSLYISLYYVIGLNWPRILSADRDQRWSYKSSKQLKLDQFRDN